MEPTWLHVGANMGPCWLKKAVLARLGPSFGRVGGVLEASWAVLDPSWAVLEVPEAFWSVLEAAWMQLGRLQGALRKEDAQSPGRRDLNFLIILG